MSNLRWVEHKPEQELHRWMLPKKTWAMSNTRNSKLGYCISRLPWQRYKLWTKNFYITIKTTCQGSTNSYYNTTPAGPKHEIEVHAVESHCTTTFGNCRCKGFSEPDDSICRIDSQFLQHKIGNQCDSLLGWDASNLPSSFYGFAKKFSSTHL